MEYMIDHSSFREKYSRLQVQTFIDEHRIGLNTKIWKENWGEWRMIRNTNFDLTKAKLEVDSVLPENLIFSLASYINAIDTGSFYRGPFSRLYMLIGIFNLCMPFFLIYRGAHFGIFGATDKVKLVFWLLWIVLSLASWLGFQLWWDRSSKVNFVSLKGDEFVAMLVIANFIQTVGEWIGLMVSIVGFSLGIFTFLIFGSHITSLPDDLMRIFVFGDISILFFLPLLGYLLTFLARICAEILKVFFSMANNIKK